MTAEYFSDFPELPFYEVARQLAKRTRKPITFWLFTLSNSACTEKEPLTDSTVIPLLLLPDDSWRNRQEEPRQRRIRSYGIGPDGEMINSRSRIDFENTNNEWELSRSSLQILKRTYSPYEITGTREALEYEGIVIKRVRFCRWCLHSGYPLPRFWFTDEERQQVSITKESQEQKPPALTDQSEITPEPLSIKLAEIVFKTFWKTAPPRGHNRPTKDLIVSWLEEYVSSRHKNATFSPKAAERIFTITCPEKINRHGNLPAGKPYPKPPIPSE